MQPPTGFHPITRRSGFLDLIGPLYVDDTDPRAPIYGLRVEEQHTNSRGSVHGGVLTTLTDVALGYGTLAAHGETVALLTASLTIDFTGSAAVDDWLEARTTLKRLGSRLAFASCEITTTSDPWPRAAACSACHRHRRDELIATSWCTRTYNRVSRMGSSGLVWLGFAPITRASHRSTRAAAPSPSLSRPTSGGPQRARRRGLPVASP